MNGQTMDDGAPGSLCPRFATFKLLASDDWLSRMAGAVPLAHRPTDWMLSRAEVVSLCLEGTLALCDTLHGARDA
eukprot:CAMPEP_0170424836 /NCGR_PEP_ID=MMETSP0117_2-20130122/37771_1 /TAXON_ID=400756 /ORGANISM="Durinskia baltica, Strain CSIRO CS-38" /LENGTH=74 /DNA_ID=CAMNT_0010683733 /DNA_START=17 /DNA_END=242 /DNA_ORIENTATION=+